MSASHSCTLILGPPLSPNLELSSVKWVNSIKHVKKNNIKHMNSNYSEGHEIPAEKVTGSVGVGILGIVTEEEAPEILGAGSSLSTSPQGA